MNEPAEITAMIEDSFSQIIRKLQGPPKNRLWSCADIGAYLAVSTRQARDTITKRPEFPARIKITAGIHRWNAEDVIKWANSHKVKKVR